MEVIIFAVIITVAAIMIGVLRGTISLKEFGVDVNEERVTYKYRRRNYFMTKAEHDFYGVLAQAVGNTYTIFAQVHLPTLVDHSIRGQNWRAALAHINRKSVDFVLCDKIFLSPKLAIELDDSSHGREDRQVRDREVERILLEAGVPLLRIWNGNFDKSDMVNKIMERALK